MPHGSLLFFARLLKAPHMYTWSSQIKLNLFSPLTLFQLSDQLRKDNGKSVLMHLNKVRFFFLLRQIWICQGDREKWFRIALKIDAPPPPLFCIPELALIC